MTLRKISSASGPSPARRRPRQPFHPGEAARGVISAVLISNLRAFLNMPELHGMIAWTPDGLSVDINLTRALRFFANELFYQSESEFRGMLLLHGFTVLTEGMFSRPVRSKGRSNPTIRISHPNFIRDDPMRHVLINYSDQSELPETADYLRPGAMLRVGSVYEYVQVMYCRDLLELWRLKTPRQGTWFR